MTETSDKSGIIIELIKQDMLFHQYLAALRKLGIEVYDLDLDLMSIVAMLMNVEDMTDPWMELYVTELGKCKHVPIRPLGKNLYPLAEECYKALFDFGGRGGEEDLQIGFL